MRYIMRTETAGTETAATGAKVTITGQLANYMEPRTFWMEQGKLPRVTFHPAPRQTTPQSAPSRRVRLTIGAFFTALLILELVAFVRWLT